MTRTTTYVETLSGRYLGAIGVVGSVLLLISLIIGASGPATFDISDTTAYLCPGDLHIWNSTTCRGVQLSLPNTTWSTPLPEVTPLSGFWSLSLTPYLAEAKDKDSTLKLTIRVDLYGRKDTTSGWSLIAQNDTHQEETLCYGGDLKCETFVLVYEAFLSYRYYLANVSFLDDGTEVGKQSVGDVGWEVISYDTGFSRLQIAFRIVFLIIGLALLSAFVYRVRQFSIDDLCFEQRWLVILISSLIMLNNPFFPFEFLARSWFFSFLGALMETIFLCTLFLFLLFVVDRYRKENVGGTSLLEALVKVGGVFVFGALSLTLYAWVRIREREDPVLYDDQGAQGVLILDNIVTVLFALLMVWIVALSIVAVGVIHSHTSFVLRFRFLMVPSAILTLSMLIAMFFRVYGPFNRNAMSFMYFYTLYNVYVWVLSFGFWPIRAGYSTASESSPLAVFEKPSLSANTAPPSSSRQGEIEDSEL